MEIIFLQSFLNFAIYKAIMASFDSIFRYEMISTILHVHENTIKKETLACRWASQKRLPLKYVFNDRTDGFKLKVNIRSKNPHKNTRYTNLQDG